MTTHPGNISGKAVSHPQPAKARSASRHRDTSHRIVVGAAVVGGAAILLLMIAMRPPSQPATDLASDERLVLLPSHASFDAERKVWRVHVRAWIFEPEAGSVTRRALKAAVQAAIDVPDTPEARQRFERRISPFLYDNERGKTVAVRIGKQDQTLGLTDKDGQVAGTFRISAEELTKVRKEPGNGPAFVPVQAVFSKGDRREVRGRVQIIAAEGLSVISDIDDTIKVSNVTDKRELLANTFHRPFRPVVGMPELYRALRERGAVFHYVSASPWQLLGPLEDFRRKNKFPAGVFHLRRFRLVNVKSLDELTNARLKQQTIEALLREFPRRRFLLFGDTGERDPEIYGDVARKHSGQVRGIFVRNVTKESPTGERLRKALRGIDAERWALFEDAGAVRTAAVRLAR
jgi:phosphatidate phosphatase APP1